MSSDDNDNYDDNDNHDDVDDNDDDDNDGNDDDDVDDNDNDDNDGNDVFCFSFNRVPKFPKLQCFTNFRKTGENLQENKNP